MALNDPALEASKEQLSENITPETNPEAAEAAAQLDAQITDAEAAVADVEQAIADQTDVPAEATTELTTMDDVIAAAKALAERPAAEIERVAVSRLRQRFLTLQEEARKAALEQFTADGGDAADFTAEESAEEARFKEVLNAIKDKKAAYIAEQNAAMEANLAAKQAIIDEINRLAEDTDNVNKTFNEYRELQDKFNTPAPVPATAETALWKRFQEARERYSDNLKINKELRDYDFRKNLELKEAIVDRAVALAAEADVLGAFKALQELHLKWREIGPVAKELRDDIWTRFKDASAEINKRYQAHFEERKEREAENERAKTELCERVEALDFAAPQTFAAWEEMTKDILAAQEEWRKIGFASRKMNNALFNRFRATCDTFFALKGAFYKGIKDELAENLAKKTALAERAEALSDSTDWKATTDALVELQKEWKTIGAVAKKHSDAIWNRFRAACDKFFENKKKSTSSARLTEHANLQAKRDLITELDKINAGTPKAEAIALINDLRERWKSIGHVPFRDKDKVYDAFRNRIDEVRKAFGLNEPRGERRASGRNDFGNENGAPDRDRLLRIIENRRAELRTYENNLGFLSAKSKSGNSLVRDFEKKIERLKADIADLEAQAKALAAAQE